MENSYLDNIMQNDFIDKNSTEQFGGKYSNNATGGFPPIYKCNKEELLNKKSEKKEREFNTKTTAVSIMEIIKNRRNETPFTL